MKRGLVISISGVDGTGKTTQAALLIKYLRHRGYRCVYSHVRFGHFFSVPLLALARIGGFTRIYRTAQGTQVGIHFFGKSKALASLYPITFYIDTAINMALKVHLHTLFGRIVADHNRIKLGLPEYIPCRSYGINRKNRLAEKYSWSTTA